MPLAEAVKYVAAAYAVILVVFIAYLLVYSRRIGRLQREVQVIDEELDAAGGRRGRLLGGVRRTRPTDHADALPLGGGRLAWNTSRSSSSGSPFCSTRPASSTFFTT